MIAKKLIPIFLAWLFLLATPIFAQQAKNNRIVFLRILVTDTSATLQSATITPGQLKDLHKLPHAEELAVRAVSLSGDSLWEGRRPFPLTRKIEFVDASGNLNAKLEKLSSAELVVRMPYFDDMYFVEFYKQENAFGAMQNTENVKKLARRQLLGRFEIEDFINKED
jgi:hypothetical protein